LQITEFIKPTLIKACINVPKTSMLYLSIPYDKGWNVTDNEQPTEKFILTGGMTGVLLQAGNHNIELKYTNINFIRGLWISLITLIIFSGLLFFARKPS
jgi:uncharacterized membrane protein YfhO